MVDRSALQAERVLWTSTLMSLRIDFCRNAPTVQIVSRYVSNCGRNQASRFTSDSFESRDASMRPLEPRTEHKLVRRSASAVLNSSVKLLFAILWPSGCRCVHAGEMDAVLRSSRRVMEPASFAFNFSSLRLKLDQSLPHTFKKRYIKN